MGDDGKKKTVVVGGMASILLVAMVVCVTIGVNKSGSGKVGTTNRAVRAICTPTSYKETCESSLADAKTNDPKELIKVAFKATIDNIGNVMKNSALLNEVAKDKSTKDAFKVCEETLQRGIDDLHRSVDKVGQFDLNKVDDYVEDVRVWLSAVITNQVTCIDAFENTTGDNADKMKNLLKTTRELSSNGLVMVSEISTILASLQLTTVASSRRLLSTGEEPGWVKRRLLADPVQPNAVVAQDGSGQFKTVTEAIASVPEQNTATFVILVKAGKYVEQVEIPKQKSAIVLVGEGPLKTIISGSKNFAAGDKTYFTATVVVDGTDFIAKDIAFENTAGAEGHQAVALRVSGDKAIFHNVHMNGYQDTLYAHNYRQFYRDCTISGTIDFIFGDALSVFQNCVFLVRKPMENQACMVTAQGRLEPKSVGAIIIHNGHITAEPAFVSTTPPIEAYLGRPWKELSRTIIMKSSIDAFISPLGWAPWNGDFALDTCYYGEYQNTGPGSDTSKRVTWKGIQQITPQLAETWTPGAVFTGDDVWIKNSGVPYVPTL